MEKYTAQLFEKLQDGLRVNNQETDDILQKTQQAIEIAQGILDELRDYMSGYTFKDNSEEVNFFKEIEPRFHAELIYYVKLFQIESSKPAGGRPILEHSYNTALKQIHVFFLNNQEYYKYYRTHATYLDDRFFIRESITPPLSVEEYSYMLDNRICTTQSYKTAKIIAYEQLQEYLENALQKISNSNCKVKEPIEQKLPELQWTASKTDLIELLYGLQSVGAFNNSRADVKKVAGFLEKVFDIRLGNYYRVFQEIRIRKKSRTSFLDLMRERLIKRMDDTDLQEY